MLYNLHGYFKRRFGDGTVEFKLGEKGVQLAMENSAPFYRIDAPKMLEAVALSEDRRVMLLLLTRSDTKSPFYHAIVRIRLRDSEPPEIRELMPGSSPDFNAKGIWVSELGAVSKDGRTALLRLSRPHRRGGPSDVLYYYYEWQTWDIEAPKKISEGLRMGNSP